MKLAVSRPVTEPISARWLLLKSLHDNLPLELTPPLDFDDWWAKTRDRANLNPVALGVSRLDQSRIAIRGDVS